jgi:hypothetical protein
MRSMQLDVSELHVRNSGFALIDRKSQVASEDTRYQQKLNDEQEFAILTSLWHHLNSDQSLC